MVDDTSVSNDLLERLVTDELGWEVTTATCPDEVIATLERGERFDVAIVDLSFPNSALSGLDVLVALHERDASCRLVLYTDGDPPIADLLRDAWEALPLATALSKSSPLGAFLAALRLVAETGSAPVDPVLQPLLPRTASQWRSLEGYGRLVVHAGHAKLWQALIELDEEPSYEQLARHTGLKLHTVRNYRTELLDELALHYMARPKMREMQVFAKRCRPLLAPHIRRRLGDSDSHRS